MTVSEFTEIPNSSRKKFIFEPEPFSPFADNKIKSEPPLSTKLFRFSNSRADSFRFGLGKIAIFEPSILSKSSEVVILKPFCLSRRLHCFRPDYSKVLNWPSRHFCAFFSDFRPEWSYRQTLTQQNRVGGLIRSISRTRPFVKWTVKAIIFPNFRLVT